MTVLSDTNKRFLYDVGVYDSEDDENVCFFIFLITTVVFMHKYIKIIFIFKNIISDIII
jgi:hypothetical protein